MSKPILMPQVGQDLTEGKLVEWRVKVGDTIAKGDIVAVVESEKASFEVEAYEIGTVLDLLYKEGDTTEVLAPIMFVGDAADTKTVAPAEPAAKAAVPAAPSTSRASDATPAAAPAPAAAAGPGAAPTGATLTARSSPLARRLARSSGLDVASIAGSGPRGAVVKRDIDKALQAHPAAATQPPPTLRAESAAPSARQPAKLPAMPAVPGAVHRVWLRKGDGDPIVLIHGFGSDLNGWRMLVGAGSLNRPVLAIDLPGHGRSAGLDRISLASLADTVASSLSDDGVTAVDLVGHSLGAAVAVTLAETARFTVRSLFLISPAGLGPDINGAFLSGFSRARSPESLAPWMGLLVSDPGVMGPAIVKITADSRAEPGVAEAQDRVAQAMFPDGTQAFSVRERLGRLPGPVRIVFGADDRIIPPRHAAGLPGTIGLHVFQGVGHMPHLEAREPVARLLAEHLRSVG